MALVETALPSAANRPRKPRQPRLTIAASDALVLWRRKQATLIHLGDWQKIDEAGWIEGSLRCPPGEFMEFMDPSNPLHARLFAPGATLIFYGGPRRAGLDAVRRARALGHKALALRGGQRAWKDAGGRIAAHPQSPAPALRASFGLAVQHALAAVKARLQSLQTRIG
ncbi:MAG: hypothetical protein ABW275_07290 [Hansschlegelia sp.]